MKLSQKLSVKRLKFLKMKRNKLLIWITLILLFFTAGCSREKAGILFNKNPINEKTIYDTSTVFEKGNRIYYLIVMPEKVESRYLYIQIIKKDNDYGQLGYKLIQTRDIRLKDEEINYFTDYFVLNEGGYYFMRVYSKDNPHKIFASAEFYVAK